jgi:tetraacyldisaccharide 4'-kinase
MRPSGEALLQEAWGGGGGAPGAALRALTAPLELLMRGGVALRNEGFSRGWLRSEAGPIPVVSVGNLTVGGTGKTPVTGWLVRVLREVGGQPAVISRGYGSDELALHRRWSPDVPVIAAPRRIEGVRRAASEGAEIVVLDDGFQHRALRRDLDLVLVAAEQPERVHLLPRGPYREALHSLGRADRVLVTRRTASRDEADRRIDEIRRMHPGLPVHPVLLRPGGWRTLRDGHAAPPHGPALAVTSIAGPAAFAAMVRLITGNAVELLAFPDHHEYRADEVAALSELAAGRPILTTEKDAVKLGAFSSLLADVRVLTLEVVVEEDEAGLRRAVANLLPGRGR